MSKRRDHLPYFGGGERKIIGQLEFSLYRAIGGVALLTNHRGFESPAVDSLAVVVMSMVSRSPTLAPYLRLVGV